MLTLANDGDVIWPEDCILQLVKKHEFITVLEQIPVGAIKPQCFKEITIEIFAFSSCNDIENIEFELRHTMGSQ